MKPIRQITPRRYPLQAKAAVFAKHGRMEKHGGRKDSPIINNHSRGRTLRLWLFFAEGLLLVRLSPDFSLFGFLDQLFTEIRMGNGNQFFGPVPGRTGFKRYRTIFGDNKVDHLTGNGCDASDFKVRDNARHDRAVLFLISGRQANEAATALGPVRTQNKVRHTAVAGNLLEPGTLRVDLSIEVNLQGLIDGNQIIYLGKPGGVVHVSHAAGRERRVTVDPVIKFLSAERECVVDFPLVEGFFHATCHGRHRPASPSSRPDSLNQTG